MFVKNITRTHVLRK